MMFKAKAEAEKDNYQAQGLKAGEDFVDGKQPQAPFTFHFPVISKENFPMQEPSKVLYSLNEIKRIAS